MRPHTGRAWLEQANAGRLAPERLLLAALLLKAAARALAKLPELNGFWVDGTFQPGARRPCRLGHRAARRRAGGARHPRRGPQVADELMAAMRDLVQRARGGGLRSSSSPTPPSR